MSDRVEEASEPYGITTVYMEYGWQTWESTRVGRKEIAMIHFRKAQVCIYVSVSGLKLLFLGNLCGDPALGVVLSKKLL